MNKDIKYFARYVLVNGGVTLLNFLLYAILNEFFNLWYVLSSIVSYLIAVAISFYLTKAYVFRKGTESVEALQFLIMKLVVGSLSTAALWVFVDYMGFSKYMGQAAVTGVFLLFSYGLSKMIFMRQDKVKDICQLLRVKHWIKNVLVFLPAVCGGGIGEGNYFYRCLIIFTGMCFLSSAVYIVNDLCDLQWDLKNPRKTGPIVSGRILPDKAKMYFVGCILAFCVWGGVLRLAMDGSGWLCSLAWALLYLGVNIGYSVFRWKEVPVLEIVIVVFGYIARLEMGGIITDTPISSYLFLTINCLALYMVTYKRFKEKEENGGFLRKGILKYAGDWLEKTMNLSATLALVFYSLWAIEAFQTSYTVFIVVGALLIFLLYSFDIERFSEGDPITVVYKDKALLLIGIVYFACVVLLLLMR